MITPPTSDRTQDAIRVRLDHFEAQLAVVDQQALALAQHTEQFGVRQTGAGIVAGRRVTVEDKVAGMADHRLPALEGTDPQLRPLQVAEHRDGPSESLFRRAHRRDGFGMGRMIAVAHVDAKGIGTRAQQVADHVRRAAGRPQRRENLHPASALIYPGHA